VFGAQGGDLQPGAEDLVEVFLFDTVVLVFSGNA